MIGIDELRSMVNGAHFESFANSVIHSLLDRLEAAERERDDVAQQLVQAEIGKRKLEAECDELLAKIAQMERQEPDCEVVGQIRNVLYEVRSLRYHLHAGSKLYTLPGAKGE